MKRTTVTLLLALASQHALGAIEPGDYIFLYGQSAADEKLIATEMMKLALGPPTCPRRKEPTAPVPDIEYIRTLARVLPPAAGQGASPGVCGQTPGWS